MNTCTQCGQEIKQDRTSQQNRYLHKILTEWGKHLGYSLEEIKCLVKIQQGLYSTGKNKRTGEDFIIYESSADWDKEKFARVIDWIVIKAGETGFHIQSPQEYFETAA